VRVLHREGERVRGRERAKREEDKQRASIAGTDRSGQQDLLPTHRLLPDSTRAPYDVNGCCRPLTMFLLALDARFFSVRLILGF
jgi:hypothetical protein